MLVFFTKIGENPITEEKVDTIDIVTDKYVIKIRRSGVNIAKVEQSAGEKKGLVPIYDETLDLT